MDKKAHFKDLWDKKWKNLTGDEKVLYQGYTEEFGDAKLLFAEDEVKTVADSKMVLSRDELQALISEAIQRERESAQSKSEESTPLNTWMKKGKDKDRILYATLKKYQKDSDSPVGLCIDYKFHKNEWDENARAYNKAIYKVTVRYDDKTTEVVEIPLQQMAEMTAVEHVKIIGLKKEEQVLSQGFTRAKPTRNGYIMSGDIIGANGVGTKYPASGPEIELKVFRDDIMCTIQRTNGEVLTLPASKLNQ